MTPELLDIGRITKAHGLGGEVVVELWTEFLGRLDPGTTLTREDGQGTLTVHRSRRFQDRFLVIFDGVEDRRGAEALRGVVLQAAPVDVEGVLWVHELLDCEVVDQAGTSLGVVVAVEPNPASDLLVLEAGGLVPLRFLVSHEPNQRIVVDVPEGLLE